MARIRLRPGQQTPEIEEVVYDDHPVTAQMKEEVLEQIPLCDQIVEESVARWKQKTRNRVREQLRLQMHFEDEQAKVQIEVVDGEPKELIEIFRDPNFRRIHPRLRMQRANIKSAANTCRWLGQPKHRELVPSECQPVPLDVLNQSEEWLSVLAALLEERSDRLIRILVNPDVLGTYWSRDHAITIHWLPIGLLAIERSLSVQDIVPLVLFHEYVHAFHHLGFDSDGNQFQFESFARSESSFKEGIAQYYTWNLIESYADVGEGVRQVWDFMQSHCSETYRLRKEWLGHTETSVSHKEKRNSREREVIRLAVMTTRRQNERGVTLKDFEQAVESARIELGRIG